MIEMISNSFYESQNNFFVKKRRTDDEKDEFQWELKKVFVKWKYFQIGLFCESCRESEICFT